MRVSKYIKVDTDVLVEWIYDDDNFITENYRITEDTLGKTRSFSQQSTTGIIASRTNNATDKQLFSLNANQNKYGVVNTDVATNKYSFLQYQTFSGNVPFKYDIIRVHFPINYNFVGKLGFLLNISLFSKNQNKQFSLCNYYYDNSDVSRTSELMYSKPFTFQEKLWGKYIEISIPSPNALNRDYQVLENGSIKPTEGSIHKNLVENDFDILDPSSPAFLTFGFLISKSDVFGQKSFISSELYRNTISIVPEYESLAVQVKHATNGDYFEINGIFNNNISDFSSFMRRSVLEGKKFYIIYEITLFEKNIKTSTSQQYAMDNFDAPIEHRPIIKFSTTTATLQVTMKLVNSVDSSSVERQVSYVMLQDEVGKYSKYLTKINTVGAYKPKIYNSKPEPIQLTIASSQGGNGTTVRVPVPMLVERYNILTKNKSEQVNDDMWYGMGQSQIMLYPTDNILKLVVAQGTTKDGIKAFPFSASSTILLMFKSDKKTIEIPLFFESGEVNLTNGVLIFKIDEYHISNLRTMYDTGYPQYYILLKTETGISTPVYSGKFIIYN